MVINMAAKDEIEDEATKAEVLAVQTANEAGDLTDELERAAAKRMKTMKTQRMKTKRSLSGPELAAELERVYDMNEKKCPDHNEVQRLAGLGKVKPYIIQRWFDNHL
eukprot:SAG22_NODE_10658_length_522_cov_1.278960_1_plen_107_part_10